MAGMIAKGGDVARTEQKGNIIKKPFRKGGKNLKGNIQKLMIHII
jgi:hypothetical protein